MKKTPFVLILVFAASFSFLGCVSARPAAQAPVVEVIPSITIVNNTGYPVRLVHISLVTDPEWDFSDNWLTPNQELSNGQSVTYQMRYPLSVHNSYDILLVDTDGDAYAKPSVPVTDGGRIVFTMDDWGGFNIFE